MAKSYMSFGDVSKEQKKGLDYKIGKAVEAIAEGFRLRKGMAAVAFSGGKDSTVLWDLIRRYFPEEEYAVIFGNTGVEFPESLKFARKLGGEWSSDKVKFYEVLPARLEEDGLKYEAQKEVLDWLIETDQVDQVLKADGKLKSTKALEKMATPEMMENFRERGLIWKKGQRMSYWWCADQYGFPILGKAASKLTARRINIDCFLRFSKSETAKEDTKEYYELLRHVKTSNHCCTVLKKEPSELKQAELGVDVVFKGLMAAESHMRLMSFATRGYIFESSRPHTEKFYHVSPLGIWTDDDIWEYIRTFDVPYSPLYEMEYLTDYGRTKCKVKRNGCVGCATDIAFENNHFAALRQTHPMLWEHYMRKGMADQLIALERYKTNGVPNFLYMALSGDSLIDRKPCAFDDVGKYLVADQITFSEYDSEIIEETEGQNA